MHTAKQHKPEFSVVMSNSRQVNPFSIAPAQTMVKVVKHLNQCIFFTHAPINYLTLTNRHVHKLNGIWSEKKTCPVRSCELQSIPASRRTAGFDGFARSFHLQGPFGTAVVITFMICQLL